MSACLWDEVSQLPIIENIVEQSIARGINTYLLGEKRLEQKLDTLKENMKSEHSLREKLSHLSFGLPVFEERQQPVVLYPTG